MMGLNEPKEFFGFFVNPLPFKAFPNMGLNELKFLTGVPDFSTPAKISLVFGSPNLL